jgi:hypothetical protein
MFLSDDEDDGDEKRSEREKVNFRIGSDEEWFRGY